MLAGHRREITAMFCDLRNFTTFSETAEPEEVLGFLRRYHATVGALVVEHEGTLEHFAGDGLMVFFNDPELQDDHAARAVRMAVAIRERFVEISEEWRRRGHVLAGRDGHRDRLRDDGPDRVRGPLRLRRRRQRDHPRVAPEQRGRRPARSCIAQRTFAAVDGAVAAEPAGERQLKGFSRPMPVYRGRSRRGSRAAEVVVTAGWPAPIDAAAFANCWR